MTDDKSPLVSVIIPVHNRVTFLKQCLDSVAAQTHQNIEVFVVDDASTDAIETVVQAVDWPKAIRPTYIRLDENMGPGGAREIGRQQIDGQYVVSLDSDDVWLPQFVEEHVANLRANPQADLSYSNYLITQTIPPDDAARPRFGNQQQVFHALPDLFWPVNWLQSSSRMWTRAAVDKIGAWLAVRRHTDVNYALRAGCFDVQICYIPEILAYYREGHGDIQVTQEKGIKTRIEEAKAYLDAYDHLMKCDKLANSENAVPFAHLFFETASNLLLLGEAEYSKLCLQTALSLGKMSSSVGFSSLLTKLSQIVLSDYNAGRLSRRLRYQLLQRFSPYHR